MDLFAPPSVLPANLPPVSIVLALSFAAARQRVNGRLAVFDIND
jgi:hypothetical protein